MGERESALVAAIVDMREEEAMAMVRSFIAEGMPAQNILDLSRAAMDRIGQRFEEGEYFLPELMMAGEMLDQIAGMVKPLLAQSARVEDSNKPKVVIGTVEGDLHDIGKNIVCFMLEVNGFEVVDIGVDAPAAKFIQAIQENKPAVVGLSGFLTLAFDAMKKTVEAIKAAGLREQVKVMIGGGQVDDTIRNYTGADAFGVNAMAAVALAQKWTGGAAVKA